MYTWGYIKDVSLAKLDLDEMEASEQNLLSRFPFYANEAITQICSAVKPKYSYAEFVITKNDIGKIKSMPSDFISFGDDVSTIEYYDFMHNKWIEECHDEDLIYKGYNQLVFLKEGKYTISYNARWITFDKDMDNDFKLDIPNDILDCLPSYIAHQCYKVDDENKAAIFRNEFEMALARIDNTNFRQNKTFTIGGDW